MNKQKHLVGVICILLSMLCSNKAGAVSGFVKSTFQFWNQNGNFCDPALQTCTGHRYHVNLWDHARPLENALVEVWVGSNRLGFGTTDQNGTAVIAWSSVNPNVTNAYFRWYAKHGSGAFFINDQNGNPIYDFSPLFSLNAGTTAGAPQDKGIYQGGTSANPEWYNNAYWALEREYRMAINLVGALQTTYTGVEVRGVATSMPGFLGTCSTSCASGAQKRIQLDSLSAAMSPQGRTMHEAGHVASYLLKPYKNPNRDCWDPAGTTTGGCIWYPWTPEWAHLSFEEAFATFFGDVTTWLPNATVPTSCISANRCDHTDVDNRIEDTHWAVNPNNCDLTMANPEARWMLSAQRTLWDVYDTVADAPYETVGEGAGNFWRIFGVMTSYQAGINDLQIDEPWQDAARTIIDNLDGRGMTDYEGWYNYMYVNIHDQRAANCGAL